MSAGVDVRLPDRLRLGEGHLQVRWRRGGCPPVLFREGLFVIPIRPPLRRLGIGRTSARGRLVEPGGEGASMEKAVKDVVVFGGHDASLPVAEATVIARGESGSRL